MIARDRGEEPRSSNATIYVTVRDENDNIPVILNITSGVTSVPVAEVGVAIVVAMQSSSNCSSLPHPPPPPSLLSLSLSHSLPPPSLSLTRMFVGFRHWHTYLQC